MVLAQLDDQKWQDLLRPSHAALAQQRETILLRTLDVGANALSHCKNPVAICEKFLGSVPRFLKDDAVTTLRFAKMFLFSAIFGISAFGLGADSPACHGAGILCRTAIDCRGCRRG